ncbi:collagen alpha-1(XVI) chain-like [Odocoileus virginianus]|uniref:Collagen alpha-1(XVI) chain-like n=1 Tax=Odocoileus virginianus TaxID=9874 RepID=A0ABM4GYU0_ODOVR
MEGERETEKLRKHGRKPREISQLFAINSLSSHSGSLLLYISKTQPPRAEQHHSQIPPSPHRATLPLTALRVRVPGTQARSWGRRSEGTPAVSARDSFSLQVNQRFDYRCCSCRGWGGSRLQSRKPAPEDQRAKARGRPGSGTAAPAGAPGSPPPSPSPPPPPPGHPQSPGPALPGRPYLRDESGEGRERPRAGSNSCLLDRPRSSPPRSGGRGRGHPSAQERGGKGHAARGESRARGDRALPPPSHPARQARSPRRTRLAHGRRPGPGRGLPRGGLGTTPSPAGRSSPRPPGADPSVAATRSATRRVRGQPGGVTTLRAPRRLLGSSRALGDLCLRGTGLSFPVPLLRPPSPSRMLGSFSPLQLYRVELRYLIILLLLLPAPAELLCLSHRFPVSHVVERGRERRIGSRSATICEILPGDRTAGSIIALVPWRKLTGQSGQLPRISERNPRQKLSLDDCVRILTA